MDKTEGWYNGNEFEQKAVERKREKLGGVELLAARNISEDRKGGKSEWSTKWLIRIKRRVK